jgi:hypothetical protein
MTREGALTILSPNQDAAVREILALAEKAEKYDQWIGPKPTTPSAMTPTYHKENHKVELAAFILT